MATMEELSNNDFFRKKLRKVVKVFDTRRTGNISLADYDLIVDRYEKLGISAEHLEKVKDSFQKFSEIMGLTDHSISITYEQFEQCYIENLDRMKENTALVYTGVFSMIDSGGKGKLSYNDWENYYKAVGIDIKHARSSFESMNTTNCGYVTKEEFIAFNDEFFYSADNTLNSSILYGPLDEQ